MINNYGADAVRWFILSDSPPEKDVQWSDTGVDSANKFYNEFGIKFLHIKKKDVKGDKVIENNITLKLMNLLTKLMSQLKILDLMFRLLIFIKPIKF